VQCGHFLVNKAILLKQYGQTLSVKKLKSPGVEDEEISSIEKCFLCMTESAKQKINGKPSIINISIEL